MRESSTDQAAPVADLQTTTQEYETIFDAVVEAIFLLDVDEEGTIRYQRFNEREEEFTGKSTADVRGKTPVEVFGDELGGKLQTNYRTCVARQEPITYEETLHASGDETVWRTTLTPIVEDGTVERIVGTGREITELQASKQKLQQRLSFLENTSDVIILLDETGLVQYQNHCRDHLPGPNVFDLTGADPAVRIHPDDRDRAKETFASVVAEPGATDRNELRIKQTNGEYGWYEQRVLNLSENPAANGILVSSRNISDRKEKQAKLEGIFEAARDVSFIIAEPSEDGRDAVIREYSPGAERLFGYTRPEAVGESVGLLHRRAATERIPDIHELIRSGESWYGEVEHVRNDGSTFDAVLSVHPLELEGQLCFLGVSIDISERKRRERALEQLHSSTRELMSAATTEAVATIGSETAAQVLDQPMNGIHLYEAETNALVPAAWTEGTAELLAGPPPTLPVEDSLAGHVYRTGDPEYYTDLTEREDRFVTDTPFRSEVVLPLGEHGVFVLSSTTADAFDRIDTTLARVLAANIETALTRATQRQQLERQNDRLDEFASVLSHDIRNPLNVAKGHLEMARTAGEHEHRHLAAVGRAHDRIQTLVDSLLALARSGDTVDELAPLELHRLADICWQNVETERATLEIECARTIRADRDRLKQLFENLYRNAVEHGGEDTTVLIGALDGGFYVADSGPGIPESDHRDVFEAGYSTNDAGTGFGLRIVRRIVEAHGWEIRVVESEQGGARFEITGVDRTD
ncbi:sensor box histidine kinase [Natronomonas moolapensis 8.8.11]|uniref:histidine kinase n=1 Tax=Natronomonas moolapensis (strain DSM 18674 / CECT 7526 / JCM 14361 / 8.8.11) TaxID=268739 RepID=M1XRX7_NATM8|nr:PAS domain S-box protein [Natronomonas moolapensis]CCQ37004.1 sensor box histidine kinase [Natronomonas moolapensis 8.8.11]